jgi:hypothetical protein
LGALVYFRLAGFHHHLSWRFAKKALEKTEQNGTWGRVSQVQEEEVQWVSVQQLARFQFLNESSGVHFVSICTSSAS